MPFFDIFASPRWSPLRMRTKVASFFIFFQELSNKKKIKALRPKMTKIASRGSCLKSRKWDLKEVEDVHVRIGWRRKFQIRGARFEKQTEPDVVRGRNGMKEDWFPLVSWGCFVRISFLQMSCGAVPKWHFCTIVTFVCKPALLAPQV